MIKYPNKILHLPTERIFTIDKDNLVSADIIDQNKNHNNFFLLFSANTMEDGHQVWLSSEELAQLAEDCGGAERTADVPV